jgi:Kef-type K+ transport system membrane component KefB
MPDFSQLLVVVTIALAVPLLLSLRSSAPVPAVVVEIAAGIAVGPAVLGWVTVDPTIEVVALIGLAFVLFLAGLELDLGPLRGRVLTVVGLGFVVSCVLAALAALVLAATGLVETPTLVAVVLCTTALGVLVPVLKDAGMLGSAFGSVVIAAGSIADIGAIVALSVLFSTGGSPASSAVLVCALVAAAVLVCLTARGAAKLRLLHRALQRLEGSSAQIRVRIAMALLIGFAALAEALGLEVILGAFLAGVALGQINRSHAHSEQSRSKLEAMGYGFFIPVFFVASGVTFDVGALVSEPGSATLVPIFLLAMLAVRGLPVLLYRPTVTGAPAAAAALLQATSLPFVVVATAIGVELGLMGTQEQAALVGAGLLSVLLFPAAATAVLARAAASQPRGPLSAAAAPPAAGRGR